jgi:hypothetical protein
VKPVEPETTVEPVTTVEPIEEIEEHACAKGNPCQNGVSKDNKNKRNYFSTNSIFRVHVNHRVKMIYFVYVLIIFMVHDVNMWVKELI